MISKQSKIADGITTEQFEIDLEKQQAICPAGNSGIPDFSREEKIRFRFADQVCLDCPLRDRCCTGKVERTVCVGFTYPLLQQARQRQTTETFKKDYHQHRSRVEGCLSALVRGNGMRVSRYISNRKRHLQALFCGTAANIKRVAHWQAGKRPKRHHPSWGLNLELSTG